MESPNSTEISSKSFTLFPKLPPELRLKIWVSTFTPRILELRTQFHSNTTTSLQFTTYTHHPITLSINLESRLETLRYYQLSFSSKTHSPKIYINFSLDTIYLDSQTFFLLTHPPLPPPHIDAIHPLLRFLDSTTASTINRIKSLAIDEKIWLANPNGENATNLPSEREDILAENARAIRRFEGLEELIIVHHGVNIAVPCAYSYLRRYELHKKYLEDRKVRWPLFDLVGVAQYPCYSTTSPLSSSSSQRSRNQKLNLSQYNTPNPQIFIRYLDKPLWSPHKQSYSPVLRGGGMGVINTLSKKEFDRRYNEPGECPIYGWELEGLERGVLEFFELGKGDFMDEVGRGCVEEDRRALEREGLEVDVEGKGERGLVVRSVGLIRGGEEC